MTKISSKMVTYSLFNACLVLGQMKNKEDAFDALMQIEANFVFQ